MKKLMKVLPVVMVMCIVVNAVFAVPVITTNQNFTGNKTAAGITNTAKNIWGTVVTIIQILAVAAVVFAGVRYMFASADQKADIKKSMGILAIGAILVFGATLILNLIGSSTSIITNK